MQAEVVLPPGAGLTGLRRRPPVQHSAREQVNAQVLNAASQEIESLAQQRRWHDYRYTFKVYIPSQIATAAPVRLHPASRSLRLRKSPSTG
ncbi:hypothetical protein ECZU24_16690 [Escherichia coli]|nr:hypothetical protein ECZU24_16690 [Escherichia coli]